MSSAESSRPTGGSAFVSDLRRVWHAGRRGEVIRAVLDRWDDVLAADNTSWLEPVLRTSGLPVEAFALQCGLLRRNKAGAQQWEFFIESVLNSGDPWWARQLLQETGCGSRGLQALRIETELALHGADAASLISEWLRTYQDEPARAAAVGWWVACGQIAAAEDLLRGEDNLPLWQARFALWKRQPAAARALLARLAPSPLVDCLHAIAAEQEGDLERAEALLRPLLDTDARGEAAIWLCTVLRKQRRFGETQQMADVASFASPAFHLVPRLDRELAAIAERAGGDNPAGFRFRALRQRLAWWMYGIRRLENAPALYALGLKPRDSLLQLEATLERFAGNHSAHLTTFDAGVLSACHLPRDPRHLGASIQRVLWTRGAAATRALYKELAPQVDGHPLFRIYQGELELWVGEYQEAARVFEMAIQVNRRTRWAWIGLGASRMLQGDLQHAQKTWKRGLKLTGVPGPTLYVYRGECYRRQGDVKRARVELEMARQQKPQRLSTRINLALLDGDRDALARAEQDCIAHAPLLMEQLAGNTAERLEQVLQAMRGNRSSSSWHVSYHLWGRIWRRGA